MRYQPQEKGTTHTGEVSDDPSEKGELLDDRTCGHTEIFAPLGDFLPLERDYRLLAESGVDPDFELLGEVITSDARTALEKFGTLRRYFKDTMKEIGGRTDEDSHTTQFRFPSERTRDCSLE
jgi:hypothetical protein